MGVTVRKLVEDDWKTLREVRLRALLESPGSFYTTYEKADGQGEDGWREGLRAADRVTLLAEVDDRGVGMIVGAPAGEDEQVDDAALMLAMWVEPESRGQGVADDLTTALIEWSRAQGYATLVLWVYGAAPRAAAFYRRAGFVPTGRVETFGDDSRPLTLMTQAL